MSNKITKTIASGLIISTIVTNSKVEVQADSKKAERIRVEGYCDN